MGKLGICLSQCGAEAILSFETGGQAYYEKRLSRASWPGGASGVTWAAGYDAGYYSPTTILRDWSPIIGNGNARIMAEASGKKGASALRFLAARKERLKSFSITWPQAREFFSHVTLPSFVAQTAKAFPGMGRLYPDAQSMLVSLVFNRGASLSGPRRAEMARIRALVPDRNYAAIADQYYKMKRLWPNLRGLRIRRDAEAKMILNSKRNYSDEELLCY